MTLSEVQESLCENHEFDFTGLSAIIFNCTLKPTPEPSHTDRLIDIPKAIFKANGIPVEVIRPVDLHIAYGVQPNMTEHGASRDDWPSIWPKVKAADILILATPIWLGEESSACRLVIERLYGMSGLRNDQGQSLFYGRTGGALITGNEDGIKHCAMTILYALQHLGYAIPPQADAGWIGEAGPGPSYGDDGAGLDNDFTQRNTTFMTWNLMHMARMLRDTGGIPAHGNRRDLWEAGCRFDNPSPDYR
jgi:multimeric flavodoxin WrbA